MTTSLVKELLRQLPASPGVYIMRNSKGNVLYVGKAKSLRNRVKSYFTSPAKLTSKTQMMVSQVNDFDFFVVSSEQEALILELNLIKRYWPPYNVLLKDDKTFPYLKIKLDEDWPRLHITRKLENDGSHYFGPFASISSLRNTVDVLKRAFPLRSCTRSIEANKKVRPCLKYYMGYCLGPCTGMADRSEYHKVLSQLIHFLQGRHEPITRELKKKMILASEKLEFERAVRFRDQLQAVRDVIEGQNIAMKVKGEQDAIAFAADKDQACAQVFMIRHGKLIGRESYTLKGTESEEPQQIMTSFVQQFYSSSPYVPRLLVLQYPVDGQELLEDWLSQKRDARVRIEVPRRGRKKRLIDIVAENASQGLEQVKIKQLSVPAALSDSLKQLQKELQLPGLPSRIEGYDVSNIQGTDAVASMVVFEDGKPKPAHYRRFKIKTVVGANDFAMLQETLRRRFKRALSLESDNVPTSWSIMPNLVLIDGGKGQLSAASEVLKEMGLQHISLASLAKENEEIFVPGRAGPIILPKSELGLKLLQRLRDEAHRFAISYFQKVHKKRIFASALDEIQGVGPRRKKALIKYFGSVKGVREAPVEELAKVRGITRSLAQKIKESL